MRLLALSIIVIFYLTGFPQELETKKITTTNFKEIFTVNKATKLESGTYVKLDKQNKDTLISGTYLNGVKSGIWRYFSKGDNLWMTYNFDRKAFEKLPEEISRIDSFVVKKADSFTYENVDLPPVYLGAKNEIGRILASNFKVPLEICQNGKSGLSIATFTVNENGIMQDLLPVQVLSDEVFSQMKNAIKLIDGDWIPAKVNGGPVSSQVVMVYDITPSGSRYLIPDNPKAIIVHFQYSSVAVKRVIGYEIRRYDPRDIQDGILRK